MDRALLGYAHLMVDLGGCLLNWIESGRVRRQGVQFGGGIADHLRHRYGRMRSEITHDHHVAWLKCGSEQLLDVGAEAFVIDGTIQDARSNQTIMAEGTQESQRAPVAMRRKCAAALPYGPQATQGVQIWLAGTPALPPSPDVGTGLSRAKAVSPDAA